MTSQPSSPDPSADNRSASPVSPEESPADGISEGRQAYNIVSDTILGPNLRKSDNLFQIKVVLVCLLIAGPLGAIAGALATDAGNRLAGALIGGLGLGFAAVVLGVFGSGIYLMIYRAVRHLTGKHD